METIDVTSGQRRDRQLRRVAIAVALTVVALSALTLADSAWASGFSLPPAAPAGSTRVSPSDQAAIDAATQQAATAVANASQNNVQNVVVIIRVNSPGDDVINQSNTSSANGVAANTSSTNQGAGTGTTSVDPGQDADPSTGARMPSSGARSEEHTSELQSHVNLV